jgi:hypothetical protein
MYRIPVWKATILLLTRGAKTGLITLKILFLACGGLIVFVGIVCLFIFLTFMIEFGLHAVQRKNK